GTEERQRVVGRLQERPRILGQMRGHVVQRAKRLRREQGIAAAPEDAGRAPPQLDEPLDDGGLPDAGFAEDERNAPIAAGRLAQRGVELLETGLAFQKPRCALHPWTPRFHSARAASLTDRVSRDTWLAAHRSLTPETRCWCQHRRSAIL